jgi:hypothetical protein
MPRVHVRSAFTLALGVSLVVPNVASGQFPERDRTAHARYLALNVLIGATTSMARAAVSGAPIRSTLAKGLVGGSMMSAGMELIGTQRSSARFAGLQLTAVGASITRNADAGVPVFSDITLPLYPFYVRVRPSARYPVTARLSAMSTVRLVSVMSETNRPKLDWRETMATGAPVFRSSLWRLPSESCPPPCEGAFAQHNLGAIVYSASAGTDYDLGRSLAHESLHLAQQTRDILLHAIPASDAALARLGEPGRAISRSLVVDVMQPLRLIDEGELRMRGAPRRQSWYETEARAFAPGGERR